MRSLLPHLLLTQLALTGLACAHGTTPSMTSVWLDVDSAAGVPRRDIDDAVAMIQAFHAPQLTVRGVSVVFGNTTLKRAVPIAEFVSAHFGPPGLKVYPGAEAAGHFDTATPATEALAQALAKAPLTLLVLGPATNIASLLVQHPELAGQIQAVVAVAGRRPGQRFTTGTESLKGHRDFNFEQDPEAFKVILDHEIPLVLAPWELSSTLWITQHELQRWASGPPATQWLAAAAPSWLKLWKDRFAVDGFNPFDTLAVGVLTAPALITCEVLPVQVQAGPDDVAAPDSSASPAHKAYLVVDSKASVPRHAKYCYRAHPAFHEQLMQDLLTEPADRKR